MQVQHYGLLAHRDRGVRLAKCRALVAANTSAAPVVATPPALTAAPLRSSLSTGMPVVVTAALALPLLLGVLSTPAASDALPGVVTAGPSTMPVDGAPAERCPGCGKGRLLTVWRGVRPTARQLERQWRWNTS